MTDAAARARQAGTELLLELGSLPPSQQLAVISALARPATSQLRDGTVGYHMRRDDDCWLAALATCLQVPLDQVPDSRIDERLAAGESVKRIDATAWAAMLRWLDQRGLAIVKHAGKPTHLPRWIGIVPVPQAFASHSVVMTGDEVLFDPAVKPGVRMVYPVEIRHGYSFRDHRR